MAEMEKLTFSINSRLLEELGENLVTKNHVALAELIKNAYDADTTKVLVEFENARKRKDKKSEICIVDNGVGMTFEQVRDHWMQIATPDKRRNPLTARFGREKTGDKGIGRFACRRLADELQLITQAETDDDDDRLQRTSFHIPWDDYDQTSQIEEVPVAVTVERIDDDETGTDLKLIELNDVWNQQSFDTLRRNILTLTIVGEQNRDGFAYDPGFNVEFDAEEFDKGAGTLLEQFHEAGWGRLEGKIDSEGRVRLKLEAKLIGEPEYTLPTKFPGLSDTELKISYLPWKKEHFRDPQTLSKSNAREIMKEYSGVRVYKSGFRVFPYGDRDDDWLGIERYHSKRKGKPDEELEVMEENLDYHRGFEEAMLSHPRNEQLVGQVNVSSEADLIDKTNREGFVQNETFENLKKAIRLSLQWMTLHYSHYQYEKQKKERKESAENLQETMDEEGDDTPVPVDDPDIQASFEIIDYVNESWSQQIPSDEREISDELVEQATTRLRTDLENKESQIRFYQSAFSVTQLIFNFSHELRGVIGSLGTNAGTVERIAEGLSGEAKSDLLDVAEDLDSMRERIQDQMSMFGTLMDQSRERSKTNQDIDDVYGSVKTTVQPVIDYHDIELNASASDLPRTPDMFESEIFSVLLNLVTNSIKATIAADTEGSEILVEATEINEGIRLRVYDNGIGLPESEWETAFDELVTDVDGTLYPRLRDEIHDDLLELVGSGTGLGLPIVRNIARDYGGDARFVDAENWSTGVEVTLYER